MKPESVDIKVKPKELKKWGLPSGKVYKSAMDAVSRWEDSKTSFRNELLKVIQTPEDYLDDESFSAVAKDLTDMDARKPIELNANACPIKIYGADIIEPQAVTQMYTSAKLPVSIIGALMPDAHQGYGLPIGGVLAVDNAVIPYAVGVDIGCRMQMTVYDLPENWIGGRIDQIKNHLIRETAFGAGKCLREQADHAVLDDERFDIPFLKNFRLKQTAITQLGSSGGGNHFVEFGIIKFKDGSSKIAILSHSGSRGFGAQIAKFYTKLAMDSCKLPKEARHLAYMSLDSENGQEYWNAMNLAGEYAQACHDTIHARLARAIGENPIETYMNFHNLAWKETLPDGRDAIVHRKGATPAGKGVYGIIPGSMTTNSYIVVGRGNPDSLNSSSHGGGRAMSRTVAKEKFTMSQMKKDLQDKGVELVGGSLDECSMAYKDIEKVMDAQKDLVDIIGTFRAKVVRMAGD